MQCPACNSFVKKGEPCKRCAAMAQRLGGLPPTEARRVQQGKYRETFTFSKSAALRHLKEADIYLRMLPSSERVKMIRDQLFDLTQLVERYKIN